MARILRFSVTMNEVKRRLVEKYPDARPIEGATCDANHTLWMISRLKKLDSQRKVIAWYNWILAKAHTIQLIDVGDDQVTEIRSMARRDMARLAARSKDFINSIIDLNELSRLR